MKTLPAVMAWSVCVLGLAPAVAQAQDYETPPVLQAAELAPPGIPLQGETYRVDAEVPTDGLLATYTIRSDFGRIEARGPGMLKLRVGEAEAVARLRAMKTSDVFVKSLTQSGKALGDAAVNVVTNTKEVAKAVPAGVGRFLERTARSAKTAVQKMGDVKEDKEAGAPRGAEASTNEQNVALAAGESAGNTALGVLGYDEKRRGLAKELQVDPYTTNPVLKKALDDVAWAAFAGGLGVDVLAMQVPGGRLVQSTSTLSDWIYTKPPGDLKVWMENSLQAMGVDQETIDLFLRQKYWTLTMQTALVMALEKLAVVEGRADVLDTAVTADDEDQTRFLAVGLSLLAREHAGTPFAAVLDGKPIGLTKEGRVVATLPLDYVCWTERVAQFASREDLASHRPEVLIPGRFSPRAKSEMEGAGWEIREGVPLGVIFEP
jgi:antitoxin (DNA-binding transcriptional repressor) of toxin-antitoxin stability system